MTSPTQPTVGQGQDILALADRLWRELDPHRTSVIRGVPDDFFGDDPRINIFDEKVDEGKPPLGDAGFLAKTIARHCRHDPVEAFGASRPQGTAP